MSEQSTSSMANDANVFTSPTQEMPGSATLGSFDESPFLDQDLEDGNFDWDDSGEPLFGDLPGGDVNEDGEHHEKRKASIDEDEEGTSKRREGGEKNSKKPGRKPLTGEPTTKRKAQNRAAQRAFRERKERHLKDLETKVEDLEKASEATNHENGRLRAQVERLNNEVKEYRKRLSLNSSGGGLSPPSGPPQSRNIYTNNDFQFAFPKFGDLPSSFMNNGSMAKTSSPNQASQQRSASTSSQNLPGIDRKQSSGSITAKSPTSMNGPFATSSAKAIGNDKIDNTNVNFSNEELSGLFSPSILETASRSNSSDYITYNSGNAAFSRKSGAGGNTTYDQGQKSSNFQHNSSTSLLASPISTMSQSGLDSSAGTTPESYSADSPDNRKPSEGALNTINEGRAPQAKNDDSVTTAAGLVKSPGSDVNGIDWLAQQNGGNFDPVLWGDYRDPQDNILNTSFDNFFKDAFPSPVDFTSPYNTGELIDPQQSQPELQPQPQPQKRNLMDEIEIQQNGGPEQEDIPPISNPNPQQYLTCEKLWDRVQSSEKIKSGAADMDELCSQLKAKAKCSGSGAVIEQKEVDKILGPPPTDQQDFLKMFS